MKVYEIVNVTDYDGNQKPERIGRLIAPISSTDPLNILSHNGEQIFTYVDGAGAFITSPLVSMIQTGNKATMRTRNSIYTLKEKKTSNV